MSLIYFPIIVSFFAILFAWFLASKIKKSPIEPDKTLAISSPVQDGAMSYFKRQYVAIGIIGIIFFIILLLIGWKIAIGFLIGAFLAGLSVFIGAIVLAGANNRGAEASEKGLVKTPDTFFKGGIIAGLMVVSFGLLAVSGYYFLTKDIQALIGLGLGASLISIFSRVGGGIYAWSADAGAGLVSTIDKEILKDDPRNPATVASLVGDKIVSCAGMAADIFETYTVSIIATMILGALLFPRSPQFVLLPLILGSVSILASIVGSFFVRLGRRQNIIGAMYKGIAATVILSGAAFYPVISKLMEGQAIPVNNLYFSTLVGLVAAIGTLIIGRHAVKHRPVKSTVCFALLIIIGAVVGFVLAGIYGVALTSISMLSISGIFVAIGIYVPSEENAIGIAEIPEGSSGFPEKIYAITIFAKGYAIASACLVSLVLFLTYFEQVGASGNVGIIIKNPKVIAGFIIGALFSYLFASRLARAVKKTAGKVVEEAKRQFKQIAGLMEGTTKPDYLGCVKIIANASINETLLPALIVVLIPIFVGFTLGPEALGGLLIGGILAGLIIGVSAIAGGAGKDDFGIAINSLIKGFCIVALLIIGFLV